MATLMAGNKSPRTRPWHARIYINRKAISLGYYRSRKEALEAEEGARNGRLQTPETTRGKANSRQ